MKSIIIQPAIKNAAPDIQLAVISAEVKVKKSSPELLQLIHDKEIQIKDNYATEDIAKIPALAATRDAYRTLGKDPARYRPSAEALMRRVLNGKGLYQINNVVEIINLTSIATGFSIGGYDADKISGDIYFDKGSTDDPYIAIGRGKLNIEGLPVFYDNQGPFGSPTSDSVRTMITDDTKHILLILISFHGNNKLEEAVRFAAHNLEKFASSGMTNIYYF